MATSPRAVADDDTLYVFARSLDGPIRWWTKTGATAWRTQPFIWSVNRIESDPVVVRRDTGIIDVYFNASHRADNDTIETVEINNGSPSGALSLRRGNFALSGHRIAAFSWGPIRQDVYVRGRVLQPPGQSDGTLIHWGKGFLSAAGPNGWWEPENVWWGPEKVGPTGALLDFDPIAVSRGTGDADIFFRDRLARLHHWTWQGSPDQAWVDRAPVSGQFTSDPVAVARNEHTVELVLRTGDHSVQVWKWRSDDDAWDQREWNASFVRQAPPDDPLAATTDDEPPDFLLLRPEDHTIVGVTAPSHNVDESAVPHLVDGGGPIRLTFPPQHLAEQVATAHQTVDTAEVFGAVLSGPSRVSIDAATRLELTSAGLLSGLDGQAVNANSDATAIELPRGLILAPQSPAVEDPVVMRHPTAPVGRDGVFALWRTRFGTSRGDGALPVQGLRAGRDDDFPVALPKADRILIAEQNTPAAAERLELTTLGGTLTASARWNEFEWDHRAVLGRDHAVRTSVQGVLYPFGHRAVWVQTTHRSDDEDVAVLRKVNVLHVVEPLVRPADNPPSEVRNAFPFSEVELTVREFRDLDEAYWSTTPRPTRRTAELEAQRDDFLHELRPLQREIFPEEYQFGPTTEMLAESDGRAAQCLRLYAGFQRLQRAIDLLEEEGLDTADIKTFVMATRQQAPVRFPVRCRAANGDVHFAMPLVFVADLDLRGDLRPPFTTLSNPAVAAAVREFYTAGRYGIIDLPGVPIDLTPADAPGDATRQTTVHRVHRLNVVGNAVGAGFQPSLGIPGDQRWSWAADIELPSIRTLTGHDPAARIAFSPEHLNGHSTDVALHVMGEVADAAQDRIVDLVVDFTKRADRAGGLAAPKMVIDRISAAHGLVNAGAVSRNPMDIFQTGASLLGFPLADLLATLDAPPDLKTIARDGVADDVVMTFAAALKPFPTEKPMFKPASPASTVSVDVLSSAESNKTTCVITDFALRMPPGDDDRALIELSFRRLAYQQHDGQTPTLAVDITGVAFLGSLRFLNELREVIDTFSTLPVTIDASRDRVVARYAQPLPDITAMSFVMSNVVFSAALTVPFDTSEPMSIGFGFASRQRPFTLTVLMFGGGGYVDLELIHSGLRRLEISLQFGAAIAINFGVGRGEVHVFGGIRYALVAGEAMLTGYLHIGGSLDVLGLVSVAIEMRIELTYRSEGNALVGRATLVIDIDVTLYSDSFELDSGEWVIAGDAPRHELDAPPIDPDEGLAAWQSYRNAFA